MKTAAKKGNKTTAPAEDVVPTPVLEVAEDGKELSNKEEEPSEEAKNTSRVQFTKPIVKYIGTIICTQIFIVSNSIFTFLPLKLHFLFHCEQILSHHSGTILADKDPVVPLDNDMSDAAKTVYSKLVSVMKNGFQRENLGEVSYYIYKYSSK